MEVKSIYVITCTHLIETGKMSFKFMFDSKAPFTELADYSNANNYGFVKLTEKEENEVNPFKLMQGEPNAIGPDGIKKWRIYTGDSKGQTFGGSVEEVPKKEDGLMRLLEDIESCILLMDVALFERFSIACNRLQINIRGHHFDGELSTS